MIFNISSNATTNPIQGSAKPDQVVRFEANLTISSHPFSNPAMNPMGLMAAREFFGYTLTRLQLNQFGQPDNFAVRLGHLIQIVAA